MNAPGRSATSNSSKGPNELHVVNAPSPGATASLAIGDEIAGMVMVG